MPEKCWVAREQPFTFLVEEWGLLRWNVGEPRNDISVELVRVLHWWKWLYTCGNDRQVAITDDYASWRWTVTPKARGAKRLQLVISARTVGTDGLTAETALPDQIVNVKVRINYSNTVKRIGGWALAAIIGGVLARFGEDLPATIASLMNTFLK